MHTTNYINSFITVSPDSTAQMGWAPDKPGSVAARQYQMIASAPYRHTSDDVIFTVYADRREIAALDRDAARVAFFAKGQACLRASPLVKTYGWGVHHDAEGCVALYGVETAEYANLRDDPTLEIVVGMRSRRERRNER